MGSLELTKGRKATKEKQQTQLSVGKNLQNIKSKYVLKQIFNNLSTKKVLKFVKNNKSIQSRLEVDIDNYKNYSEKYTQIELEIKPYKSYAQILDVPYEDRPYFHIYFNNNDKEVHYNYLKKGDKVKVIKIKIDYQITSFNKIFNNCQCIETIKLLKY